MDLSSHEKLELPTILAQLAGYAHFSASKELARSLEPTPNRGLAERRLAATEQARQLLVVKEDLTIGGAHDVRPQAGEAERGMVLEPADLMQISDTLIAGRTQSRLFEGRQDTYPELARIAEGLTVPAGVIDRISQVVDERGEIRDTASPELASLRRQIRAVNEKLLKRMEGFLSDAKVAPLLQEAIVTQREGRYVLPLRAEFKGRIDSIVHDRSSSGATLFVEPVAVVEMNNEARELELAEREEVRRILSELSAQIGGARAEIDSTVDALAALDLAYAKARYAQALDATAPSLEPVPSRREDGQVTTTLRLLGARHPLLDPEQVVPIDLELAGELRALVITGPNTGGKTVALKTAGLLALMALCGLQIPAEAGSSLSTFAAVFADIGDEQSIEQSLSTFSAHISNIIRILERADERSLVLLDELGAGTDPQEGASLALAILQQLLVAGATTLVATHYPELKAFAHGASGVRNASVEFDLESLRPTYHLTIGLPGRSNALAIAERLGLPEAIIERAREQLTPGELAADEMLDDIRQEREGARAERSEARSARQQASELQRELSERLEAIEQERREILGAARQEAAQELEKLQGEIRSLRNQLALAGQPLEALEETARAADELEAQAAQPVERLPVAGSLSERPVQLGDRVRLLGLGSEGVVAELGESEAEVQVGNLRVRAKLDELRPVEGTSAAEETHPPADRGAGVKTPQIEAPPVELDLRGQTAAEALAVLERRLDSAYMAGLPHVRIIHGKGTGRLREAVRKALPRFPYVESFRGGKRSEGGEGVTIAEMAPR